MGQQQLLLLVLGVIIVGIAVLGGLYAFQTKSKQFVADSLINRNLEIANAAVFWKTKKDPYNGGNASYANLADDGMTTLAMDTETSIGTFAITAATQTTLEITGVSKRYPDIGVKTSIEKHSINSTEVSYDGDITIDE